MCKAFSCIVMDNGKVFWKEGTDSHEDIITTYKICDNKLRPFQNLARVEIIPKNLDYSNPEQTWIYNIDENVVPPFMNDYHRECCFQAFKQWKENVYSKINLVEVKKPFNPFSVIAPKINKSHIDLLKVWVSVLGSFRDCIWDPIDISIHDSVGFSVMTSIRSCVSNYIMDSIGNSIRDLIWTYLTSDSFWNSVKDTIRSSIRYSIYDSIRDSVCAYTGSLYSITKWKYIDYNNSIFTEGIYPFQSSVDLWKQGLIPMKIDKKWVLIGKDENNKIKIFHKL